MYFFNYVYTGRVRDHWNQSEEVVCELWHYLLRLE